MNGDQTNSKDRLYELLPALYRLRDVEQGEPLRALLAVLQAEFDRIEADVAQLYDNWFIETCEEWVVPYIGDLLGVSSLPPQASEDSGTAAFSRRAFVANTIAYRRRKGTAGVLEQLARDVTGWSAHAVEFFQKLAVTQHTNHVRLSNLATADLRDADALELIPTPFSKAARTAEVRHIDNGRGKYNLPNVGLFLWRLQSYAVERSAPRAVTDPPDGRYTFHPVGLSVPLFNRPRTETDISGLSGEINVPGRLRRRALYEEQNQPDGGPYLDPDGPPVFEVLLSETSAELVPEAVPREEIAICHLGDQPSGDWRRPPAGKTVAVDPVLGRLSLPTGMTIDRIQVSYAYGFPGDVGGGPYDRSASVARWLDRVNRPVTWQIGVTQDQEALPSSTPEAPLVATLAEAVAAWNARVASAPDTFGLIALMDSETYAESLTGAQRLTVPEEARLALVAADWPRIDAPGLPPSELGRHLGQFISDNLRPHVRGDIEIEGDGELVLDGVLIEGSMTILPGDMQQLTLAHCTLVPGEGGLTVQAGGGSAANDRLVVDLYRCLTGPLVIADTVRLVRITASLLDHGTAAEMSGADALNAPAVECESVTILGRTHVRELHGSNAIFGGVVEVARRQEGCVRYSYVPPGSKTPRRYRCRPADDTEARTVLPVWTSVQYGDPGYGQLAVVCPCAITRGAEDENEMGVFRFLQQASRVAALRQAMDDYLRFGLEAGVFLVE